MTAKNSANVIHLQPGDESAPDLDRLADEVAKLLLARFQPGSDPGLCVAIDPPTAISEYGRRTQTRLMTINEARALAAAHQLILRPLGGDGGGIIGALAAVGLAATGNDGRFNWVGRARELRGVQPVEAIIKAGITRVQTIGGRVIKQGLVETDDKVRPALVGGEPVLLVESVGERWRAVRSD
jgi:hypothetical protein